MKIDADELSKVARAIAGGQSCWVRQGNFNPRSYSEILLDQERMREYREKLAQVAQHNAQDENYGQGLNQKPYPEFEKLPNIFEGVDFGTLPGKPSALPGG